MEHSHSLPALDAVRPWRTATLVASAIAAGELILLVLLGIALLGKPLSERANKAAAAKLAVPAPKKATTQDSPVKFKRTPKPSLGRADTRVTVLNGNGRQGAAAAQAGRVRQHGYLIGAVTNAPDTGYTRSMVMYRGRFRPEAARLAKDLGIKIVTPLDGLSPAALEGAHVAVIVGA
jgi:LytR cell envelope-related transcriptional attenuator